MSISSDSAKLYDLEITFHSAHALPISDLPTLSTDPYLLASLCVPSYSNGEDSEPPPLLFRTRTIRSTRDPDWGNEVWRVGGVPGAGFVLRVSVRDEDARKKDDHLGEARISFFGRPPTKDGDLAAEADWGLVRENLNVERKEAGIKKRRGGFKSFVATYLAAAASQTVSRHGGNVVISVRVLGLSRNQNDRRVYTIGPNYYSIHFSPLLGRMVGTKSANASNSRKAAVTTFQANKLQLTGPVPKELKYRYVGYRPFIESMFSKDGIKGQLLNRALRKQHRYIYSHDQATVYGCVERHQQASNITSSKSPKDQSDVNALAAQFLHMTAHGTGHRVYTYAITLDGQWRFTETGDEFAIEMLSKHSLHANVARQIAYSGEFFVRRIGTQGWEDNPQEEHAGTNDDSEQEKHNKHETRSTKALKEAEHHPPSEYELVIDNNSGTYRPNKETLPVLAEFLSNKANLGGPGGLGKITAMDAFDKGLEETKKRQAEARKKHNSRSGQEQNRPMVQLRRGSSVSSRQAEAAGLGRTSMSSGDVERMVEAERNQREQGNGEAAGREDVSNGGVDTTKQLAEEPERLGNGGLHSDGGSDAGKKALDSEERIQQIRVAPVQVLATN